MNLSLYILLLVIVLGILIIMIDQRTKRRQLTAARREQLNATLLELQKVGEDLQRIAAYKQEEISQLLRALNEQENSNA